MVCSFAIISSDKRKKALSCNTKPVWWRYVLNEKVKFTFIFIYDHSFQPTPAHCQRTHLGHDGTLQRYNKQKNFPDAGETLVRNSRPLESRCVPLLVTRAGHDKHVGNYSTIMIPHGRWRCQLAFRTFSFVLRYNDPLGLAIMGCCMFRNVGPPTAGFSSRVKTG